MLATRSKLNNIAQTNGIYSVNNLGELQQIIGHAKAYHLKVRTLGSGHSPTASIYSNSKREIKIKLQGQLAKIVSDSFAEDKSNDTALIRVGAGCHLGHDPQDATSTLENSFNYQIDQLGYALPTLGGISHQTIGGFISTGSSGGSAEHTIADCIEEIGFVDGSAHYRRVKKGEELFNAVGVSLGLLGVITDVTFRLPKRYFVQGSEINQEVRDSCIAGDDKSDYQALDQVLFENEYVHINWFAQKNVNRISLWTGKQTTDNVPQPVPYRHALNSDLICLVGSAILHVTNFLNEQYGDWSFAQKLIGLCIRPFANPAEHQDFHDSWRTTLPIDDGAPVDGMIKTTFCELWLPRDQLPEMMRRLKKLFAEHPTAAGNFIVELYPAKQSPFMLSPSEGRDSVRVDLYFWDANRYGTPRDYFLQFLKALSDLSVRLHWGKYIPDIGDTYDGYTFRAENLQKNYPQLDRFKEIREQMDPSQLFVSPYWRKYFSIPKLESEPEYKEESNSTAPLFSTQRSVLPMGVQETAFGSFSTRYTPLLTQKR